MKRPHELSADQRPVVSSGSGADHVERRDDLGDHGGADPRRPRSFSRIGAGPLEAASGGRIDRRGGRQPDPRHDAGRAPTLSTLYRYVVHIHLRRQLVVAGPKRRAADRPSRNRRSAGADRICRRNHLRRSRARDRRLSQDIRFSQSDHDSAQPDRESHANLLVARSPVRQRHERRVPDRRCPFAVRPSRPDSLNGALSADGCRTGVYFRHSGDGVHRRGDQRGKAQFQPRKLQMNWLAIVSIASAAIAVSFGAIGPALAEGRAVAAAMDAIARQPEAANTISRTLFVGLAMIETMAIYCLVIALLLLFANPFLK